MSIEDNLLRFEGLDPVKVSAIIANTERLLGVAQMQMDNIHAILKQVTDLAAVVQAELPRVKQLAADVRTQLAAYEAKQKEIRW